MATVQLLLFLALVAPFCGITRASTLVVPTSVGNGLINEETTKPMATMENKVETESTQTNAMVTEEGGVTEASATTEVPGDLASVTEALSLAPTTEPQVSTEAATTLDAAAETENPTVVTEATDTPFNVTEAWIEAETVKMLMDEPEDGMTTGHLVGIVIGSLLAVIIVIAVVIVVVRRMGQYSP